MLFKKISILIFLILFSFSATANAPRSTGKYKNWESFTVQTDKGKICFAQTIPTKRAPASVKREKSKLFNEANLPIGEITSGTFGPSVNGPIAMGYIDKEFSKDNTKILVEVRGKKYPANICGLPFYKKSYVKGASYE